ncbi:MAG: SHOCT domain-containing protein [Bacteroidales bacterium]|nr:SHOCT domain-containing protein [Bacteroidales bacterium]
MMQGIGHGMGIGMGWGWIIGLLLLVLVIWLVVRSTGQNASSANEPEETALDVLKKRYARGEISKEEYEEKKKDLM